MALGLSRRLNRLGLTRQQTPGGGGGGEPAITLAAPTFYDDFNSYADGTRLVAGDPNANAGLVGTNPGNLGWTAASNTGSNNARFKPIIYQGAIRSRTANTGSGVTTDNDYLIYPPGSAPPANQYAKAEVLTSATQAHFGLRGVNASNFVRVKRSGTSVVNLTTYLAAGQTSIMGVTAGATARKMGGLNGAFKAFALTNEALTCIAHGTTAFLRRGPGFPLGVATGYSFTDPGGTRVGVMADGNFDNQDRIESLEIGAANTVLLINETFNTWYPKRKAAAGDAITTGSALISFSGTYLGTAPARLQWALFDPETGATVKDWAWVPVASQTIGGGNWSVSNLSITCGLNGRKAYAIGFRSVDASNNAEAASAVVSIKHFYITLNVAVVGQSNAGGLGNAVTSGNYPDYPGGLSYGKADPPSLVQGNYNELTQYWNSTTDGAGGSCFARLGDVLTTQLNIPVSFEVMAIGARGASALGPGGVDWNYIQTHHAFAGGAFEMIYLSQGENEFVASGSSWLTQWVDTNLPAYLAMSGQPAGTVISIFQAWSGRHTGATSDTLASTKALREGQDGFVAYANAQLSNIIALRAHHYVGCKMIDAYHYTAVIGEGYDEAARRIALSIKKYLTGTGYNGMGPIATTASRSGAVITIDFDLNGAASMTCRNGEDQSLTGTASALTSWEVSTDDFATNKTITSAELVGNQVVITLSADPGGAVKVRNHYGFQPVVTSWAFGSYADGTFIGSKPIITPLVSN